jgi:hypothetical protein
MAFAISLNFVRDVSPALGVQAIMTSAGWPKFLADGPHGQYEFVSDAHNNAFQLAYALYEQWVGAIMPVLMRAAKRMQRDTVVWPSKDAAFLLVKAMVALRDKMLGRLGRKHMPSFAEFGACANG